MSIFTPMMTHSGRSSQAQAASKTPITHLSKNAAAQQDRYLSLNLWWQWFVCTTTTTATATSVKVSQAWRTLPSCPRTGQDRPFMRVARTVLQQTIKRKKFHRRSQQCGWYHRRYDTALASYARLFLSSVFWIAVSSMRIMSSLILTFLISYRLGAFHSALFWPYWGCLEGCRSVPLSFPRRGNCLSPHVHSVHLLRYRMEPWTISSCVLVC